MNKHLQKIVSVAAHTPPGIVKCYDIVFVRHPEQKNEDDASKSDLKKAFEELTRQGQRKLGSRKTEQIRLTNNKGSKISALLIPSLQPTNVCVILSHGYRMTGMKEFGGFLPWYLEQNVHILLIDHQAHGNSEGKTITYGAQEHLDLLQWIRWVSSHFGEEIHVMLHGISMGAATVMQAAGSKDLPSCVKCVVADCGYSSMEEEIRHATRQSGFPDDLWEPMAKRFRKKTGLDPDSVNAAESAARSRIPWVIIHGAMDTFVPTQMATKIQSCAPERIQLELFPGAGHAESYCADKNRYERILREWIQKTKEAK